MKKMGRFHDLLSSVVRSVKLIAMSLFLILIYTIFELGCQNDYKIKLPDYLNFTRTKNCKLKINLKWDLVNQNNSNLIT